MDAAAEDLLFMLRTAGASLRLPAQHELHCQSLLARLARLERPMPAYFFAWDEQKRLFADRRNFETDAFQPRNSK